MTSSSIINYSLRQNKTIERTLVFDGLKRLMNAMDIENAVYVGFGSVWFSDFHLAHRVLGIEDMYSIESDDTTYRRALFNRPYRTLSVILGNSAEAIPELLANPDLANRPWIVWIDYDQALNEDRIAELCELTLSLPSNSVLLTTFSATAGKYGTPIGRWSRVRTILGDAAAEEAPPLEVLKSDIEFPPILAQGLVDSLITASLESARIGGSMIPAFRLTYRDGVPMVTVGGVLPDEEHRSAVITETHKSDWEGFVADQILTGPLTVREISALLTRLPLDGPLTREVVRELGFDLDPQQIASFVQHYRRFPSFAQLA